MIRIQKIGVAIIICLMTAAVGYGEPDVSTLKEKINQALFKSEYYGEYTDTDFRFGRRQEITYRVWAGAGYFAREVISPSWQRGEITVVDGKNYYYYIPAQNDALKIAKTAIKHQLRIPDWWRNSYPIISQLESRKTILNHECLVLSGERNFISFKVWVTKDSFFPLAMEAYKNGLLAKSIHFSEFSELPTDFNPRDLFPNGIKWYDDEVTFWQITSIPRAKDGVNFSILQPSYLPEGFIFRMATIEELSIATVVHLVYEGPNKQVLSIFERGVTDKQKMNLEALKRVTTKNGLSAFAFQWNQGQVELVIVGTLPREELKKIATSFK